MTIAAHHPAQIAGMQETREAFKGYLPEKITNANSSATYRTEYPIWRPGASDHEAHPSRMGNKLVYRNGKVETA